MEAMGEQAADHTAGWAAAPGLSAASLLRGRRLRSVPSPVSRADCLASDGGAAAGVSDTSGARSGPRGASYASSGAVGNTAVGNIAVGNADSDGGAAANRSSTNPPFTEAAFTNSAFAGAAVGSAFTGGAFSGGAMEYLRRCRGLLEAAVESAREELALAGFVEAADFAGLTEEISRRFEYLQVLGAAAVDRTRTEAISNAAGPGSKAGWITGWGHATEAAAAASGSAASGSTVSDPVAASPEAVAASASSSGSVAASAAPSGSPASNGAVSGVVSPADDGCRNTAEFLRVRLRISTAEARRRLALANAVLPRAGITGLPQPPVCEETAAALAEGSIASRAGTIITTALDRVRHIAAPEDLARMEHVLTRTAIETTRISSPASPTAGPTPSTRTAPNPPKKTSATARAPSSADPAADFTTWKSSPHPTNTNTYSPS